jgi:aspartate ammonia-lyase
VPVTIDTTSTTAPQGRSELTGKATVSNLRLAKAATDLRLLSSGPDAGFGEIRLPPRQAGSSIMPGKVNPVIPEAVTQAAIAVMANDQAIAHASSLGNLELNAFLPLIAAAPFPAYCNS